MSKGDETIPRISQPIDDPAIYRPAESQGTHKAGYPEMSFARARDLAIAEARRQGAVIVGVAP